MTMIVEDGTGVDEAESYLELADIVSYATKHGLTFSITDEPAAEASARYAAVWLDGRYRSRLPGSRVKGREQGLEWPREDAVDTAGDDIDDESVPPEWLAAFCEVAIRQLAYPGTLSPVVTVGKIKRRVAISGAVDVTYADEGDAVGEQRPTLTIVDDLLSGLLTGLETGRTVVKFLSRA